MCLPNLFLIETSKSRPWSKSNREEKFDEEPIEEHTREPEGKSGDQKQNQPQGKQRQERGGRITSLENHGADGWQCAVTAKIEAPIIQSTNSRQIDNKPRVIIDADLFH
jgi:hypothetical protein